MTLFYAVMSCLLLIAAGRKPPILLGVETRAPGWGNTSCVEFLDDDPLGKRISFSHYFNKLVDRAVNVWGYKRGVDIRAAPYDFRLAPNEWDKLMQGNDLKGLIESLYSDNGEEAVVVVAHSLGNAVMLYFFNQQTQDWKNKYIHSYVSTAPAYGGSIKSVLSVTAGYNFGVSEYLISAHRMRPSQRYFMSNFLEMPSRVAWPENHILIETPNRNYTIHDYQDIFAELTEDEYAKDYAADAKGMFEDAAHILENLDPPGVPTFCAYGVNITTPTKLIYRRESDFPANPRGFGESLHGDGTINAATVEAMCGKWVKGQKQRTELKKFENVDHSEILQNKEWLDYVKEIINRERESKGNGCSKLRSGVFTFLVVMMTLFL